MKTSKVKIIILFFGILLFMAPFHHANASQVQEQLKTTIDNILEILRDPAFKGDEKKEARRAALREVIYAKFSFAKMSQLSLARQWKKRSKEEKIQFIDLFGRLLEQTYVSKIESYTNEKVTYVKEFVKKNKAMIYTKIITDTVEIPIDYRLYQTKEGDWMVYDLVIEGVSLVGNYRSQFDQMLRKESFEKLVEDLKKKVNP